MSPVFDFTENYAAGQTLTKAQLTALVDSIETALNTTKLDSTNIQSGGIATANIANSAVTADKLASDSVTYAKTDSTLRAYLVPTGGIIMHADSDAPSGFLLCDGSAVSRTTYSALFNVISTTYGTGDGSTTFNVPDMRGRAPIGEGTGSGLTARTLGGTVGTETHTLTTNEIPSHSHTGQNKNNPVSDAADNSTLGNGSSGSAYSWSTGSTGGGAAHNNMQPSLVVNFIIKT